MESNPKNNIEDIYELTPMQQGMLFHTLYNEGSDAYFEQFCYMLEGDLDVAAFHNAWIEVVKRHGVLRTSFQWKGISKPVQIVSKSVEVPFEYRDWSNEESHAQQVEYEAFLKQDRLKGFSMEKAPLLRLTLIKTGDQSYEFVWSFHHIIMDGWSYPVIQKEVFEFYKAAKEGTEVRLPKPVPYKEFVVWLGRQDKTSAEKFWEEELKGLETNTPLPLIKLGKKGQKSSEELKDSVIDLGEELTAELKKFARENQLTLNTIIQGAWGLILSEYRGEDDVMFGGTVSGRTPAISGVEAMVGLFINTMPVRVRIDYDKEIVQWLKELQTGHITRDEYSYSSLVDIHDYSGIPKGTQLFENILVFENYPLDRSLEEGVAGIKIKNLRAFERTNFPLTILIAPGSSLAIHAAYETDKFDEELIQQLLKNFRNVLDGIVKNPSGKLKELSLLTSDETQKILTLWNNTKNEFPDDKCVHELFEDQVKKTPDGIAVEFGDEKITYRELDTRANQLAQYLVKCGVGPDTIAGICIERSVEMLIAVLGVLKAGGAYVPIDGKYPKERISFMVEDTNVPVLLTTSKSSKRLPETKTKVILLDEIANELSKESPSALSVNVKPENLAYVIYTSGSTGKPKGVLMKHKALVNLLNWQINGQRFEKNLRTLQFTTLSFDVSFQEIFSTWCSGGTLIMLTEEMRQDLTEVVKILSEKKIERMFLPFIALNTIAEIYSSMKNIPLYLKEVMTAGEQVQITPAIIKLFNSLGDFIFYNQYGPSEAHVVTSYPMTGNPNEWSMLPPIGKPIFNNQIYVLNKRLKPVPAGVSGDLYIGGVNLVRGYHNRPELTDERFIDSPFDNTLSEKLYKTGDLARTTLDGDIEFLGRSDGQVKVRGIRIEPGEIEAVISEFEGVERAVIIAKLLDGGDRKLIAYIVNRKGMTADINALKSFLKSKLPEYMVPADYVVIDEIPLTPSGKINQRALPEPEYSRDTDSADYSEPKDSLELQLVKIWEKVLGVRPIGIRDNFFDLGGHSLLALRVFGYIEKLTGRKLALSTLFNYPTIEGLARILKDEGWTPPWKSLVAVKPGGSKFPFYCVPPGAGTALHFQAMMKYIPDDQPFYVLESVGLDGKEEPHTVLEEMAAFYIKEIQSLQPEGPYLIGGRCFGGRVAFEMAQQFAKLGQRVALLAIFDTWPPFTAPPPEYVHTERDMKHFVTRTFHHLKTGELWTVARRYSMNRLMKLKWRIQNKLEYIFSNEKKRRYKQIMLMHFKAQDRYIAKQYPGKITLIECATFKNEYREGWRNLGEGGLETYSVPGTDHKTIVREPMLKFFAEKLNFVLQKTHDELNAELLLKIGKSKATQKNTQKDTVDAKSVTI